MKQVYFKLIIPAVAALITLTLILTVELDDAAKIGRHDVTGEDNGS